jgi:metalloendopeptidase OMA1, mitochondrial
MNNHMNNIISSVIAFGFILVSLYGCVTAPYTGRQQILLISEGEEMALGENAYRDVLKKEKISQDPKANALVKRVGARIEAVANKPEYKWEFTVIDNPKTVNAFCLPGGKIAVYTGILPYTQTEAGLAFVMAHEIGHAIAHHGGERMSEQYIAKLGQEAINIAIAGKSPAAVQAVNTSYGVATTVGVMLPFSRTMEYEADHIGLILMAKAGYDPHEAPAFFERMMKAQHGSPPEFLSTHPADQARIRQIHALIPEAMTYYHK